MDSFFLLQINRFSFLWCCVASFIIYLLWFVLCTFELQLWGLCRCFWWL